MSLRLVGSTTSPRHPARNGDEQVSTLTERLREMAAFKHDDLSLGSEAADEIDRLTAENARLRAALEGIAGGQSNPGQIACNALAGAKP